MGLPLTADGARCGCLTQISRCAHAHRSQRLDAFKTPWHRDWLNSLELTQRTQRHQAGTSRPENRNPQRANPSTSRGRRKPPETDAGHHLTPPSR
ncbi:MAG: hypothetical protein HYY59_07380 [Candidatus Omnitrophica bacterium]|nr:hypothetical protein [Candidatus Omnitrophota bacterium]